MKIVSRFESYGNIELLSQKPIAVFASQNTPQDIYTDAQNLFLKLCEMPVSLASGWQAPLEKKLLGLANPEMNANIILYSATDLAKVKLTENLQRLHSAEKLLLVSAQSRQKRPSKNNVNKRDRLIFSQVSKILFLHITHGGRLEKYFNDCLENGLPVYIFDHALNKNFQIFEIACLNEDNLDVLV